MNDLSKQQIYKTPFSKAYWKDAVAQLKDVRIFCIAAILVAIRISLKPFQIGIAPTLSIQIGFFINALCSFIVGPVLASIGAIVSDTLGVFISNKPWIPIFAIVEVSGSLIFALMLWRTKLSATRIIISRFLVIVVCNIILNPILIYKFSNTNGQGYSFFLISGSVKNAALFPFEATLLVLFFGALVPIMIKSKIISIGQTKPELRKKHIVLIATLLIVSILSVLSYCLFYLPTQPISKSVEVDEYKLTLKSARRTYEVDKVDPTEPLLLTATLKNLGDSDISATHGYEWCDITLLHGDGVAIPVKNLPDIQQTTDIISNKSIKYTDTFAWEWSELGSLPKGKYTVIATVKMTVDGENICLSVELPIQIN